MDIYFYNDIVMTQLCSFIVIYEDIPDVLVIQNTSKSYFEDLCVFVCVLVVVIYKDIFLYNDMYMNQLYSFIVVYEGMPGVL